MEKLLYNDEVKLKFSPGNHCYYANGKICQGVTAGLKELYPQDDLLEWYSGMAAQDIVLSIAPTDMQEELRTAFLELYKGNRVSLDNKVRFQQWFTKEQLLTLYEVGKEAPLKRSQYGKDVGTIVHEMVDKYHTTGSKTPYTGENADVANKSFEAYVKWFEQSGLTVVESERMVYSRLHNYAGTLDRIYKTESGAYILGDFKTSNLSRKSPMGIRESYWSQLGAYINAYEEEMGIRFDDAIITNSPKNGTLKVAYASDMGFDADFLKKMFLDDLRALSNHKQVRIAQAKLK